MQDAGYRGEGKTSNAFSLSPASRILHPSQMVAEIAEKWHNMAVAVWMLDAGY